MQEDIISPGPLKLCPTCGEWKLRAVEFYSQTSRGKPNGYRPVCKTCYNRRRRARQEDSWATVDTLPLTLVQRFTGLRATKDRNYLGICQRCQSIQGVRMHHAQRLLMLPPHARLADGTIPWLCPTCVGPWTHAQPRTPKGFTDSILDDFITATIQGDKDNA